MKVLNKSNKNLFVKNEVELGVRNTVASLPNMLKKARRLLCFF